MKKKSHPPLSLEDNFIPGIYNYCDNWCERCSMTSRCRNYARLNEVVGRDDEPENPAGEEFWHKMAGVFEKALEVALEAADKTAIKPVELKKARAETRRPLPTGRVVHLIDHLAGSYGDLVEAWFAGLDDGGGHEARAYPRLFDPLFGDEHLEVAEAIEVIRWYQQQIRIKLARALNGAAREHDLNLGKGPSDADGSAKVAMLGIERSITAWRFLLEMFPEPDPEIAVLIKRLQDLHHRVESDFPRAHSFIRPGFD